MSNYYLRARLFPTFLTSIPLLILICHVVQRYEKDLRLVLKYLPVATLSISYAAFVYFSTMVNRALAKELFERLVYRDELYMPTTCRLLWSDGHYDEDTMKIIRRKIDDMYGIKLLSRDREIADEVRARKLITTAVARMRDGLRDNMLLLQHNIEYGFARNFMGGCLIAIVLSIGLLIYAYVHSNHELEVTLLVLLAAYSLPLLLSRRIVRWFGYRYSKVLINQFLSLNP